MNFVKTILRSFVPLVLILIAVMGIVFYLERLAHTYSEEPVVVDIRKTEEKEAALEIEKEIMTRSQWYQTFEKDKTFKRALQFYNNKQYRKAFNAFQELLNSNPDHPYFLMYLGLCLNRRGEYQDAVHYFSRAAEHAPAFQSAYVYWAIALRSMNRYKEAVELLNKALDINEDYLFARYHLGIVWQHMNEHDSAIVTFEKALETAPTGFKAKVYNRLGESYARALHIQKAEEAFQKAIEYSPKFLQPRINMARLYSPYGKSLEKRKELLKEILALNPHYAPAYYELGMLHYEIKDYVSAEQYLHNAVREDPLHNEARAGIGLIDLEQGHLQDAEQVFRDLLAADSLIPQNYFHLAKFYTEKRDYETAIQFYEKAIKRANGYYPEAWLNRGVIFERLDLIDSAINNYSVALSYRKDYHEAFYNIGRLHMKQGSTGKAVFNFRRACELQPDYHAAWYNLGLLYGKSGKIDSSIICYRRALSSKPDYIKARLNLAVKLTKAGDTIKALQEYEWITSKYPEYTLAWFNMARLLTKQKRHKQAMDAYLKLLQVDPENNKARQNLGVLYSRLNRNQDAISVYREALEQDPGNVNVRFNLAFQYKSTKQPDKAMDEFEKTLRLDPQFVKSWNNLIDLYEKAKNFKRAKHFFSEVTPPEKISYKIGKFYFNTEDYAAALTWFKKAKATSKHSYRAYYWSGKSQKELGNLREAIQEFQMSVELKPDYFYGWKQLGMTYKDLKDTANALNALRRAQDLKSEETDVRMLIKTLTSSGKE